MFEALDNTLQNSTLAAFLRISSSDGISLAYESIEVRWGATASGAPFRDAQKVNITISATAIPTPSRMLRYEYPPFTILAFSNRVPCTKMAFSARLGQF